MNTNGNASCCCNGREKGPEKERVVSKIKKTSRSLPSLLTSVLIAFFPKCPMCWAVYMSMFGSLGLARLPYMPWLLPVLLVFLAVHLLVLLRKAWQRQYFLPFWLSLSGVSVLLAGRSFFPQEKWLLISGMILIISGSLLHQFSNNIRISFHSFKELSKQSKL